MAVQNAGMIMMLVKCTSNVSEKITNLQSTLGSHYRSRRITRRRPKFVTRNLLSM